MVALEQRLHSYEPLFDGWTLQEEIGRGNYARVYRVVHRDPVGMVFESALKAVEIIPEGTIENADDLETLVREQYVNEVNLLGQLRGISNIVSYEDHAIREIREQGKLIGYDLLIRMELLTSLEERLRCDGSTVQTERSIRKIGMDLCRGLSRCQRVDILHRDIKPKNIFVNRFGDYKLGDFGIARHLEGTIYARTRIGTELYAAPEITDAQSEKYSIRADLYSLGLVLYQLANGGYLPFITPDMPRKDWKPKAIDRRNRGEELPLPNGVSKAFGEAICKACAYRPEERYASAQEMYHALQFAGKPQAKPLVVKQTAEQETRTLLDRFWEQLGLSVVLSADAQYIKQKLEGTSKKKEQSLPVKAVYDVLTQEQAQKLPTRKLRLGNANGNILQVADYRNIASWAFCERKDLTGITCSNAVESIGEKAFADCTAVQTLSLYPPLQSIGSAAFARCVKLEECVLPNSLEELGECVFSDCVSLKRVTVSNRVSELPRKMFYGCHTLQDVRLPSGLQRIGAEAFGFCTSLSHFTLPNQVNWMGTQTFIGCSAIQEVKLSAALTVVPQSCFQDCSQLRNVQFAYGLQEIEEHAFYRCASLYSLELPFGLKRIGAEAFASCEKLTFLRVPDSVTYIGDQAFGRGGSRMPLGRQSQVLVETSRESYVWNYCKQNGIRVQEG